VGNVVQKDQPCLKSECGSSDARQVYDDGSSFCFSCQSFFKKDFEDDVEQFTKVDKTVPKPKTKGSGEILEIEQYPVRGFRERDIKKPVTDFYHVRVSYDGAGNIDTHYYPYDDGKAYKIRDVENKDFRWVNKSSSLFGIEHFQSGGKRLIITEGEIDALSVAQASYDRYQKFYPVVGLSSSAMTKSLLEKREWIRSFDEVIICFDEDDAGAKARTEAIRIIGADKAKITKLFYNDASDVLVNESPKALMQALFDAAPFIPAGIIGKEDLWESLVKFNDTPSFPYPPCVGSLNDKIKGMRDGEITMFISGTGSGKSTLLREIMMHILETSDEKIGIVSLEESPAETARKLAGMALNRNPADEEIPLAELKVGFDKVFGDDRIILLDHQGSISDSSIMDQLEYMALSGCKKLFIDHITILVSEGVDNLVGNEAQDKVMNDLLRLTKRHPVWIGLVSHLRKVQVGTKSFEEGKLPSLDDIRGSGSLKQISFDIIAFARNMTAEDETERNTIEMSALKCRFTGLTGKVDSAFYHFKTGRLGVAAQSFSKKETFTKIQVPKSKPTNA